MKYSELIYRCAKAAANQGDSSMNYSAFVRGEMAKDQAYAEYLEKSYHEANAFFQRLTALGKTLTFFQEYDPDNMEGGVVALPSDCLRVISVFQFFDEEKKVDYRTLPFNQARGNLYVLGLALRNRKINIQYIKKAPILTQENICFIDEFLDAFNVPLYMVSNVGNYDSLDEALAAAEENQVDMLDYGITDEACFLCVDWVKGRCNDDKSKGHSEESEAEARIQDLNFDDYIFSQVKGGKHRL